MMGWVASMKERKRSRFNLGKLGKVIVSLAKMETSGRKSNFKEENDEFGNDFICLTSTYVILIMYLAL